MKDKPEKINPGVDHLAAIINLLPSDYSLLLNNEGYIIDGSFPEKGNSLGLSKSNMNKHFSEIIVNQDVRNSLEDFLQSKNKSINKIKFNFSNNNNENRNFECMASKIKGAAANEDILLLLINDITKDGESKNIDESKIEQYKKQIAALEREVNFYIKQGDVITNQRAKVQKERDQLSVEKNEIAKQKEIMEMDLNFIMKQGDKIAEQKHKIKIQHDLVQKQKKKIEDSIIYAKRIQTAVLPPNRFIQHLLSEHFIFYKPRDIVSGDFYWIKQFDEKIFIAAADCTGHGVPGALMSMLGITFFNEIINKNPNIHANEVLNELRMHIISSLRQTGSIGESRDGMDVALCIINEKKQTLEYAGANNPLYLIREGNLEEIKADRMPIGIHRRAKDSFVNHEFELKTGDLVYIFSDGYVDQFGGEDGRKFLSGNFKDLLLANCNKKLSEQRQVLEKTFEEWRGERKQLDDILVIGFKVSFDKIALKAKDQYNWIGKTILVAEDDEANFLLLKKALEKTGVAIIHAENGKEAIRFVKSNPDIDLILMDIRMPVMDGIEATTQIKQINKNLPIIVQTAFTMSSEKEKSFKAGCDDYISKPIIIKELYATVSKYIDKEE